MPPFRHLLDRDVGWVVILGAGSRENQLLTPEDALDEAGLKRVMEGVRLARLLPGAKLVFTGGSFERGVPIAFAMSRVALDFGMDKARIVLVPTALDTRDEAVALRDRLGRSPFYLVTSAAHMRRAVRLCERLGAKPIAAPTDFRSLLEPLRLTSVIPWPAGENVTDTQKAFHEYFGLLWGSLRGYI